MRAPIRLLCASIASHRAALPVALHHVRDRMSTQARRGRVGDGRAGERVAVRHPTARCGRRARLAPNQCAYTVPSTKRRIRRPAPATRRRRTLAVRRLGALQLRACLHRIDEAIEQRRDVVRARARFRMALEARTPARRSARCPGCVPSNSERCVTRTFAGSVGFVDREAVVLRGDHHAAAVEVDAPDGWRRGGRTSSSASSRRRPGPAAGGPGRCRRSGSSRATNSRIAAIA